MNGILALTVLAILVSLGHGKVTQELQEKIGAAITKCATKHKVSQEDVKQLIANRKAPETPAGQCMVACFFKEMGYVENGKYNIKNIEASNAKQWEDKATVAKVNNIVKKCLNEAKPGNECQVAAANLGCILREGKAQGIPPPELL